MDLTDPRIQGRQLLLHTVKPLPQCFDMTPELTLPLAHVLSPEREKSRTVSTKLGTKLTEQESNTVIAGLQRTLEYKPCVLNKKN